MKKEYLFLLIIFSALSLISTAQEIGFPIIRNYTPKEYNGTPETLAALQDNRGVMYFGVGGGVIEYDGISWRSIPIDNQSYVRDLAMDSKGKIYVVANDEFGYLTADYKGNTIYKSLLYLIKGTTLKLGTVWSVKITSASVYFQTNNAILQYLPASEQINIFKADAFGKFNSAFIYKDVYHTRLSEKGLMKIEDNQLIQAFQSEFFKNKNNFNAAVPYNSTTFLLPTRTEGIYLYQPEKDTIPQEFTISNKDFITDNNIYNVSVSQKEYFVLGSLKKGGLLIDKTGNTLQEYNEQNLLQVNKIYKITNDTTQNLWFGLGNGISKTEHSMDLSYWGKSSGLKGSAYSVIRFKGIMYIASSSAIYYIDKKNQIQEVKGVPAGQNWCFLQDKNSSSLLAGTSQGIFEIKGNNAVQVYKSSYAFKIYQTLKNPNRILSTDGNSFISLLFENGKWITEGKWEGINDNIRGIIEDNASDLWLVTYNSGVIRVTPDYDNITKPKKVRYYTEKDGFVSLLSINPFTFKDKIIWCTETGFYTYNAQTDKFEPFCELGKQFCNGSREVYLFNEMPDGKVWISPLENKNADIGYLQPNSQGGYDWVYEPFRRIPQMSIYSFYIEPSGVAWIGGSEGLYRYDLSKDTKNYKQSFNCLIRKATCGSDSLLYGGNDSTALSGFLTLTELDYRFNSLKFEFAAPFFDHEEETLYSYKLEGYDEEWSNWSRETNKAYSKLREGTYTFLAKARNVYDVESSTSTYQITILPPFYRTWWAYCLYLILIVFFIIIIVKLFTHNLIKQKEHLEEVVKNRTAEILQQKEKIQAHEEELEAFNEELTCTNEELHFQREEILSQAEKLQFQNDKLKELDEFKQGMTSMIVHDLKNPLNSIINISKTINPEKQVSIMQQWGKQMLNMVLNILDVHKYEEVKMNLALEEKQFALIAQNSIHQVQFLLEQKQITLKNGIESGLVTKVEEEVIERVMVNLLTNAIKYTCAGGTITLSTNQLSEEMVRIEVTDMGEGIAADKAHLVFQKFGQIVAKKSGGVRSTGLGLSFCKLAVDAHGGEIGFTSEAGKGTTFWFTLQQGSVEHIVLNTIENEKEIEKDTINLTDGEREFLSPIITRLKVFSVYETDDIEEIIEELKHNESANIQKWVLQIENTMDTLNQSRFLELLKIG